ncbi:MAG: DUF3263 domain-containing protein [Actinomycetota bacterium]
MDDRHRRQLTDLERELLAFERTWWREAGVKEQAIRERFDMSPTRYYQVLNELLELPAAVEHDPLLVRRLVRQRAARRKKRAARRLGSDG